MTLLERFYSKVEVTPNCWLWTGATTYSKIRKHLIYGHYRLKGRDFYAHRLSYEIHRGFIPEGLTLDHLCRNPLCVNPWHLEPVTLRENLSRGYGISAIHSRQTHCKHGHQFTSDNTYSCYNRTTKSMMRTCRACKRERSKRYVR